MDLVFDHRQVDAQSADNMISTLQDRELRPSRHSSVLFSNLVQFPSRTNLSFDFRRTMRNALVALAILYASNFAYAATSSSPQEPISDAQAEQLYSLTHAVPAAPDAAASSVELVVPQSELKARLQQDYRARLSTKDADELIRFYKSPVGTRYRQFVHELGVTIFKGLKAYSAYFSGPTLTRAGAPESRRVVLHVSLQYAVYDAMLRVGMIAPPSPGALRTFEGAMDFVAQTSGDELDVIATDFGADLPAFSAFQATPVAQAEFLAVGEETMWRDQRIREYVKAHDSPPASFYRGIQQNLTPKAMPALDVPHTAQLSTALRFTAIGNEVFDAKTHLIWARCNFGQTWDETNNWCSGVARRLNIGDAIRAVDEKADGWRVPTLEEILSISDTVCESSIKQVSGLPMFSDVAAGPTDWYLTSTLNDAAHVMAFSCLARQSGGLGLHFIGMVRLVKVGS